MDRRKTSVMDFDRPVLQSVFRVVEFDRHLDLSNPSHNIDGSYFCEPKWLHHGTCMVSENKYSISLNHISSWDVQACVLSINSCFRVSVQSGAIWTALQRCAWRHLKHSREFHNRRREHVYEGNSQPSTLKLLCASVRDSALHLPSNGVRGEVKS